MSTNLKLLEEIESSVEKENNKVQLPKWGEADISQCGIITLFGSEVVNNVFYVPKFKLNLLFVSKLTKEQYRALTFLSSLCIFHNLLNWKVKGIGR